MPPAFDPTSAIRKSGEVQPLTTICRLCISSNIDRFPPEALCILNEEDWDLIVKLRHRNSSPQIGVGGLDGTGRLHPAISEKVMLQIEERNLHLQKSSIADTLVWKDIVEYKFRKGNPSRPKGLYLPWDVLVRQINEAGEALNALLLPANHTDETVNNHVRAAVTTATSHLDQAAMNLDLLRETGIGKTVRKFLKNSRRGTTNEAVTSFLERKQIRFNDKDRSTDTISNKLNTILKRWMDMASQSGVKMDNVSISTNSHQKKNIAGDHSTVNDDDRFLKIAKQCHSWRELYAQIKAYDDDRRSKQGEKMRERRDRLDSIRPKIVKVKIKNHIIEEKRLAAAASSSSPSMSKSASKMQKLRKEANIASVRQERTPSHQAGQRNFAAAVANAQISNPRNLKRRTPSGAQLVALGDGKVMTIPNRHRNPKIEVQNRLMVQKKKQAKLR
jgi:hypothetical protein